MWSRLWAEQRSSVEFVRGPLASAAAGPLEHSKKGPHLFTGARGRSAHRRPQSNPAPSASAVVVAL